MTTPDGNTAAHAAFAAALASGAMHHAWLFTGPEGVGKATFARRAARRLLARPDEVSSGQEPLAIADDSQTARLVAAGSHPDLRILSRLPKDAEKPDQDLARSITIAQVRALAPMLMTKPSLGAYRVIIIDSADDLERPGASNALLKNLEEPPERTIFLLVSHSPARLLPTIRSRCRKLRFEPIDDTAVADILHRTHPDLSEEERTLLVRIGAGSPGRALRFAGLGMAAVDRDLERLMTTGDRDNRIRLSLSKRLSGKAAQPQYEAFLDRLPSFLAARAVERQGASLRQAIEAQGEARRIAMDARSLSLDPAGTVFELAGIVARLASH